MEIKDSVNLGVEVDQFGKDSVVVNSFPVNAEKLDGKAFIEACIESFKHENKKFDNPYMKIGLGHCN